MGDSTSMGDSTCMSRPGIVLPSSSSGGCLTRGSCGHAAINGKLLFPLLHINATI